MFVCVSWFEPIQFYISVNKVYQIKIYKLFDPNLPLLNQKAHKIVLIKILLLLVFLKNLGYLPGAC